MLSTALTDAQEKIDRIVESFKDEIAVIRVGRATPALIEDVSVEAYQTRLTIKELATIAVPEPTLLTVSPWDKDVQENIVVAIRKAELGLNPVADGGVIKIPLPRLSEERRKEMIKRVKSLSEEARIKVRQVRQEEIKSIEALGEGGISEDEIFRFKEDLQSIVEEGNSRIEELCQNKEKELIQ